MAKQKRGISYEDGLEKLEIIINALEKNEIPLDQALALFQEGIGLVHHCNGLLDQAEQKMKVLLQSADQMIIEDFNQTEDDINVSK
ncbi:Exodeoxyribonuclease 7 small subunit [Syntrophobotulus glycolicus DSM 8271]|uniref:Exodeoxyribonuclease 7 small subunit n=1 Tax=Syntrophobotulus glycolicus (strain DSM 8271 / FlGlyR) TaxID=645991 RepID=F0T099_SYNGF|nr:exodeoxyribonuclease VII small subunit [Syntrophobotulus glycolicus]ADY56186.1 Exodeoxyribonuclease 7 small subunit [Syntrophobotulus glycolicus DSM 8271]